MITVHVSTLKQLFVVGQVMFRPRFRSEHKLAMSLPLSNELCSGTALVPLSNDLILAVEYSIKGRTKDHASDIIEFYRSQLENYDGFSVFLNDGVSCVEGTLLRTEAYCELLKRFLPLCKQKIKESVKGVGHGFCFA